MKTKRFTVLLFILSLFTLILPAGTSKVEAADDLWEARYWNNKNLSGDSVLRRHEEEIDHDWGHDSPHDNVNEENFSARWTRRVDFVAGTYRFTATMDDGMRVWIDDALIIDSWYDSQVHSVSADIYLTAGEHRIKVEYYEAGAGAIAKFSWTFVPTTITNWRGEYYDNIHLAGAPTLVRDDAQINFSWPLGAPDDFSVRWTRNVDFTAGRYRFTVTADDGVRLWVNNQLIIDQWHDQPITTYTADIDLPGGSIPIKMEFYERIGEATAQLSWTRISAAAGATQPTPSPPTGTWRGEYFNNDSLTGTPAIVRNDAQIDFIWGSSSPAPNVIGHDRFSVRWTRNVNFTAGRYRFTARADDGVRLWVNNQLLIDAWNLHDVTPFVADIDLPGGTVPVRMEYFEYTGLAEAHLSWAPAGAATPAAPAANPPHVPGDGPVATLLDARHLSVRQGPGLDFEAFAYLSQGQTVEMVGRDPFSIWIEIRLPDGNTGWVSGRFLTTSYPFANLPITSS